MRQLIERLVKSGNAYVAEDNVLFSVPSMPDYGQLSKRPLDEMIAGARVEVAAYKKDPRDFVLWKPSKPGEPAWPSPAGIAAPGRPGWHIECSAMSWKYLGETFDIHGGGIDLVFPHHEDEIAQSRCAFHTPVMANYWMHNGFLQVEGEKMSKSLGNFVTINELLQDWPGEVVRFAMLQTHYRQPINWTVVGLREAQKTLDHWYGLTADAAPGYLCADALDALADDLNTPKAFAALHELRGEAVKGAKPAAACLKASAQLIGLLQHTPPEWAAFRQASNSVDEIEVVSLIEARNAARKAKDFAAVRPHPRRTRQNGRGAERLQRRHHLGDRAMTLGRHGRACPGHPRLSLLPRRKDVDARDKRGHDGGIVCRKCQCECLR